MGMVFGHRARNQIAARSLAVDFHIKTSGGLMLAFGKQPFPHQQTGVLGQLGLCRPVRPVHAADLDAFHLHLSSGGNFNIGLGVNHPSAGALACANVLFNIDGPGVFSDEKPVDAVVPRLLFPFGMDAAAGNNGNVGAFADVKIVVDQVVYPALGDAGRDIGRLSFGPRRHDDIDARLVRFRLNANILRGPATGAQTVLSDVIRGVFRFAHPAGHNVQQLSCHIVHA